MKKRKKDIGKKYELLKLNYDYSKTWFFAFLLSTITFLIGYTATQNGFTSALRNSAIFCFIISIFWFILLYKDYKILKNYLDYK